MVGPPSPRPISTESLLISHLSSIKRGQEVAQSTRESHSVLLGQILEAIRHMQHAHPKPSGRTSLREKLKSAGESVKHFKLLLDLWRLYRAVPWGTLAWGLYVLVRWLHLF